MAIKKDYVVGSGNVFADLRVPHPEEALAKADCRVSRSIASCGFWSCSAMTSTLW